MTTLRDLEGSFLARGVHEGRPCYRMLGALRTPEAEGVEFLCPKCYAENGGPMGTHLVICWFTGVPLDIDPKPGRWNPSGAGLDDLTFVEPGSTSVLLQGGCGWHGHVRSGEATLTT